MKFQSRHRINMTLESVALADIVMNLFIFFFVTFSLLATFHTKKQASLKIDLPQGHHAKPSAKQDQQIVVSITPKGVIYVNREEVPLSGLEKRLKTLLASQKEKAVEVHADRTLILQKFVEVLDIVQNVGAQKVMVRTEVPKESQ